LKVVASSDLGGLGAVTGSPVYYTWVIPNLLVNLLPWLVLLGWLAWKPNRQPQAWWIGLPLLAALGLDWGLGRFLTATRWETGVLPCQFIGSMAFGLAALWLLMPYLDQWRRINFLVRALAILAGVSIVAFGTRIDWLYVDSDTVFVLMMVWNASFALALALSLADWLKPPPAGGLLLGLRLLQWTIAGWVLVLLPALAVMAVSGPFDWLLWGTPWFIRAQAENHGPWLLLLAAGLVYALFSFLALAPFLILSLVHPFWRARLSRLLGIKCA
jgi:hypothetical protein